ncbi:MAG: dTDP-4-dehydrorhamnose reductase [bacterium]|nr:dTDP-4-dehydrorhamnose reductase [bacterium]
MHVLILGAQGMLGRALQKQFEADQVIAWDRNELDITDRDQVLEHLPICEPDLVINAAAYTDVEKAEVEEELATKVNGHAVGYLAEACAKLNIPLVHISTDYVFSGDKKEGYAEDETPGEPLNAYGRSKLLGEQLLQKNTDKYWLIRTAWLFGPQGKNFVETMINLGKQKSELKVVDDQHGAPTYTRDLAQAIFKLTHEQAPFGIYHITNGGNATWAEFAKEIFKIMQMPVNVVPVTSEEFPTKAIRPKWSILKNTKRPLMRSWQEALKDYINIRNIKNP